MYELQDLSGLVSRKRERNGVEIKKLKTQISKLEKRIEELEKAR